MKKLVVLISLLNLASFAASPDLVEKISSNFPVILLAKVTHVGPHGFQATVDWRMRGIYASDVINVNAAAVGTPVQTGDRVLVAMNRNLEAPLEAGSFDGLSLTRFDIFEGQSAFRVMRETSDYALIGEIHSRITLAEMAALMP